MLKMLVKLSVRRHCIPGSGDVRITQATSRVRSAQVDFERFDQRHIAISGSPFVTIQRGGRVMTINRAAYEMLGGPRAVELLYSKQNRVIGVRQVSPKEP